MKFHFPGNTEVYVTGKGSQEIPLDQDFKKKGRELIAGKITEFRIKICDGHEFIVGIGKNNKTIDMELVHYVCPPGPIDPWESILFGLNMTIDEFKALLRKR